MDPQSFNLGPFLTLSVRNGPSFSFGTNVPCILKKSINEIIETAYDIEIKILRFYYGFHRLSYKKYVPK